MSPLVIWDELTASWANAGAGTTPPVGTAPSITTATLGPFTVGVPVNVVIEYNGSPATSAAVIGTALQAGLSLTLTAGVARVQGTPSAASTRTSTIRLTNAYGSGERAYTITVAAAGVAPSIPPVDLGTLTVDEPVNIEIPYTGSPAASASVSPGALPAGLAFGVTAGVARVTGTPTADGAYSCTLRLTNSFGTGTRPISGTVSPAPEPPAGSYWQDAAPVTHGSQITTSNVGVPPGTTLTTYTGPTTITVNGTVIANKTINADLLIQAKNVVIRNCVVNGWVSIDELAADNAYSFFLVDSEINAGNRQVTAVGSKNFHALRCRIRGGNRSVYCYHFTILEECYISDQWVSTEVRVHASAVRQSQTSQILRNNMSCDVLDVPGVGSGPSATLTGYGDFETVHTNDIIGNHFRPTAGGFGAYGGSSASKPFPNAHHIRFIGNRWVRGSSGRNGVYDPVTDFNPLATGNEWSDNKYTDGTEINRWGGEGPE